MSEIKFKAWDKNLKKMVEVIAIDWYNRRLQHKASPKTWYRLIKYKLLQYTKLKDKNGKEIYESDIVKYKMAYDYEDVGGSQPYRVPIFPEDEFEKDIISLSNFELLFYLSDIEFTKDIEIIGNIYENHYEKNI